MYNVNETISSSTLSQTDIQSLGLLRKLRKRMASAWRGALPHPIMVYEVIGGVMSLLLYYRFQTCPAGNPRKRSDILSEETNINMQISIIIVYETNREPQAPK